MKPINYLLVILGVLLISSLGSANDSMTYRVKRSKAINKVLNLSPKQKTEIQSIKDQYKITLSQLNFQYEKSEKEFVKMYQSTNKDPSFDKALTNQQVKILKSKVALEQKKLEQGLKIRKVLSKAQLTGFNKFITTYPSKDSK